MSATDSTYAFFEASIVSVKKKEANEVSMARIFPTLRVAFTVRDARKRDTIGVDSVVDHGKLNGNLTLDVLRSKNQVCQVSPPSL